MATVMLLCGLLALSCLSISHIIGHIRSASVLLQHLCESSTLKNPHSTRLPVQSLTRFPVGWALVASMQGRCGAKPARVEGCNHSNTPNGKPMETIVAVATMIIIYHGLKMDATRCTLNIETLLAGTNTKAVEDVVLTCATTIQIGRTKKSTHENDHTGNNKCSATNVLRCECLRRGGRKQSFCKHCKKVCILECVCSI